MVLYLLDEAIETGKGANAVISMLDFFFLSFLSYCTSTSYAKNLATIFNTVLEIMVVSL